MKSKYIILILLVILIGISFLLEIFRDKVEDYDVESITSMNFFYTNGYANNSDVRYKIDCKGTCVATIKPYLEEEGIEIEISNDVVDHIIKVFNKYEVAKWNKFNESDKNVLDGDSFSLSVTYNDNKHIKASGYMMFPENYGKVCEELDNIFNKLMEE